MPIIKECNLLVLRDLYGTNLGGLDSRVTGRKVLSGDTPGISPCYGEWIEVVIKLTLEEIGRMLAFSRELETKKAELVQTGVVSEDAKKAYNEAKTAYENAKPDDDAELPEEEAAGLAQLKQEMDTAHDAWLLAEQNVEDVATEIREMQENDRACIFRFENPSPIEIFQACPMFVLRDGEAPIAGVMSNISMDQMLITILNKRRTDGWYDCRVLCAWDANLTLDAFQEPVNIFIRFWRLYN